MTATFPFRGVPPGMPPGVPPPAPVPDYMSEEKLQEKGWLVFSLQYNHCVVSFILTACVLCFQQGNGSSCRQSATQKRESLVLWMLRRKTCHLSMYARSSGTMET